MEITDMRLHKLAGWSSLVVAFLYTIITSLYVNNWESAKAT
jgi:hypothetical protein